MTYSKDDAKESLYCVKYFYNQGELNDKYDAGCSAVYLNYF